MIENLFASYVTQAKAQARLHQTRALPTPSNCPRVAQDAFMRFGNQVPPISSKALLEKTDIKVQLEGKPIGGKYPDSLKNSMAGAPVVVIGAGDLYRGKIEAALKHLGADVALVDRDPSRIKPGEKSLPDLAHIPDTAMVLVLTPNKSHEPVISELLDKHHLKGIYIEKPPVISTQQMAHLEEALERHNTPAYLGDHYVFHSLPLLALMGTKTPYNAYVQITKDTADRKLHHAIQKGIPLLNQVVNIDGTLLQSGGSQGSVAGREWLKDPKLGGGMMLDLMIHLLNSVDIAGLRVQEVRQAELDTHPDNTPDGTYMPVAPGNDAVAEDHAKITGTTLSGANIKLEVGKYAAKTDRHLILTDKQGYQLEINFGSPDTIRYYGPENNGQRTLLGEAKLEADPYLLVMHHALNAMQHKDLPVLFAPEQERSLQLIEKAQVLGRSLKNILQKKYADLANIAA